MNGRWLVSLTFAAGVLAVAERAHANGRHFAYTYEAATLPQGAAEVEPQLNVRLGRDNFFAAFDYRIEFEVGLLDRLQMALYLNGASVAQDVTNPLTMPTRRLWSGFTGGSAEFKVRLLDSAIDPIGLALYGEITAGPNPYEQQAADANPPTLFELEAKVIIDRRFGNFLLAANLIFEHEWLFRQNSTEEENELELSVGAGYFVSPSVMLGVELREHNIVTPDSGWETSALFLGPTFSYATGRFFLSVTALPQVVALVGASPGDIRTFHDHEAFMARAIIGLHF